MNTNTYTVTDVCFALRLAALRDSLGRRHVVHLTAEVPEIGVRLEGPVLRPRLSALLAAGSGDVFTISVEATECAEQYVLERLHPGAVPGIATSGPGTNTSAAARSALGT